MSDASDIGANSAVTDYGGFEIELTEHELYYLRAAGIPPHLLNNSDRAAVIRALMVDTQLIEDQTSGGFASLVFKAGALRDMLELTDAEKEEAELDALGVDAETRALLKGAPNKLQLLAQIRLRRQQEMSDYKRELEEREYEIETRKEKEKLEQEILLFNQLGAARYAELNPIPAVVLDLIVSPHVGGLPHSVGADDTVVLPLQDKLVVDPATSVAAANVSSRDVPLQETTNALNKTNSNMQDSVAQDNPWVSEPSVPKSIDFKDMPVIQQDILQALADIPKSIKLVPETMEDQDPTHLKTELPEMKVHHEELSLSRISPKKPNH